MERDELVAKIRFGEFVTAANLDGQDLSEIGRAHV